MSVAHTRARTMLYTASKDVKLPLAQKVLPSLGNSFLSLASAEDILPCRPAMQQVKREMEPHQAGTALCFCSSASLALDSGGAQRTRLGGLSCGTASMEVAFGVGHTQERLRARHLSFYLFQFVLQCGHL